jgi:hypothetical protein
MYPVFEGGMTVSYFLDCNYAHSEEETKIGINHGDMIDILDYFCSKREQEKNVSPRLQLPSLRYIRKGYQLLRHY